VLWFSGEMTLGFSVIQLSLTHKSLVVVAGRSSHQGTGQITFYTSVFTTRNAPC